MKKYFLLMIIAFTHVIYAQDSIEKIYVEAGAVYVGPDKIFVNIEGEFIEVQSLAVDEQGVFIQDPEAGYCGRHGPYPGSATVCPRCMVERKKRK